MHANIQCASFFACVHSQVLDYQNTAHTLLPLVASAYALHFMGETIMGMYKQFDKDR